MRMDGAKVLSQWSAIQKAATAGSSAAPSGELGGHPADRRAPVALAVAVLPGMLMIAAGTPLAFAAGQLLILVPLIAAWLEASKELTQGPALYCLFWALPMLLAYLQLER